MTKSRRNQRTDRDQILTLSGGIYMWVGRILQERVRRGVEEVFEGVSLKTKIGSYRTDRLVSDVRGGWNMK